MSMTELAGHMGVTVATMPVAIDRLERKGYARRAVREAKSVLDPVRVDQVLKQLSSADRVTALRGLDLLARASNRHMRSLAERRTTNVERRTSRREP